MTEHVWFDIHSQSDFNLTSRPRYTVYMKIGDPPEEPKYGRPSRIEVEIFDNVNDTSFQSNEVINDDFTLTNYLSWAIVKTSYGVEVKYTASSWRVEVKVSACYKSMTYGLCSNFDDNKSNEYIDVNSTAYTSPVVWAHTWRTDADDQCEQGDLTFDRCTEPSILNHCAQIQSQTGMFAQCHQYVPPQAYYDECVFDYCIDDSMRCPMIEQYASECMTELKKVNLLNETNPICDWTSSQSPSCTPPCGQNMVYKGCANPCRDVRTCGTRQSNRDLLCANDNTIVSMCVCKDGFVMEDGKCIPETQCGCIASNGASYPQDFEKIDCDNKCSCKKGVFTCEAHPIDYVHKGCGNCTHNGVNYSHGFTESDCIQTCSCQKGNFSCRPLLTDEIDSECIVTTVSASTPSRTEAQTIPFTKPIIGKTTQEMETTSKYMTTIGTLPVSTAKPPFKDLTTSKLSLTSAVEKSSPLLTTITDTTTAESTRKAFTTGVFQPTSQTDLSTAHSTLPNVINTTTTQFIDSTTDIEVTTDFLQTTEFATEMMQTTDFQKVRTDSLVEVTTDKIFVTEEVTQPEFFETTFASVDILTTDQPFVTEEQTSMVDMTPAVTFLPDVTEEVTIIPVVTEEVTDFKTFTEAATDVNIFTEAVTDEIFTAAVTDDIFTESVTDSDIATEAFTDDFIFTESFTESPVQFTDSFTELFTEVELTTASLNLTTPETVPTTTAQAEFSKFYYSQIYNFKNLDK